MLILDSATNCISSLSRRTTHGPYGAIAPHNAGLHDESARLWNVVLAHNANFDLAYTGIAGPSSAKMTSQELWPTSVWAKTGSGTRKRWPTTAERSLRNGWGPSGYRRSS